MNSKQCIEIVLDFEGGYVNHPQDPGGETNYGISKRSFPEEDIKNMTRDRAVYIYTIAYWDLAMISKMPPAVRLIIFDSCVNQGITRAAKFIQTITGSNIDGIIGPNTINSLVAYCSRNGTAKFIKEYFTLRMLHYSKLKMFKTFGKGWTRRLIDILFLSDIS